MSDLEQARARAAEDKATFLRMHREACIAFGNYCQSMEQVQRLTTQNAHPMLGILPEEANKLSELFIRESPVVMAKRSGLDVTRGWGWDKSTDVVPLVESATSSAVA
jgi:hypothetical protein